MEVAPQARRRKACDLCTVKRIRCDGLKPLCSNCRQYGVECKITQGVVNSPASRSNSSGAVSKARAPPDRNARIREVEARLARVEAIATANVQMGKTDNNLPGLGPVQGFSSSSGGSASSASMSARGSMPVHNWSHHATFGSTPQAVPRLELPPEAIMRPTIDKFFQHFNSVIPLFDETEFRSMMRGWSDQRCPAEWAAINIVLALGYRVVEDLPPENNIAATCIANAQSVQTQLMSRTQDNLGLQVFLGLALLFQGMPRSTQHRETPMLMGAAVRLLQVRGLNLRDRSSSLPMRTVLHQSRLFWITYILDKDTSHRFRIPSLLMDSDTEHALPVPNPTDNVSHIASWDGTASMNFLHRRVQLAYIQGRIFDVLHSPRNRGVSKEERVSRTARLRNMLHQWYMAITPKLRLESVMQNVAEHHLQLMTALFNTHLLCVYALHGLHKVNDSMIMRIRSYDFELEAQQYGQLSPWANPQNPLPYGWEDCVTSSRASLQLSTVTKQSDYYIWHDSCSIFAAGLVLLVNMIEYPTDPEVECDQILIDQNLGMYERLMELGPHEVNSLRADFYNLENQARDAVSRSNAQSSGLPSGPTPNAPLSDLSWGLADGELSFGLPVNEEPSGFEMFERDIDLTVPEDTPTDHLP